MSVAKRIWEIERMAGMDPADGSTNHSGLASYQWTIDVDHMENLDVFVEELRNEFGEKAVTQTTDINDCVVVLLHFKYPYADLNEEIDKRALVLLVFDTISKINKEIVEKSDNQAPSLYMEVGDDVIVKFAGMSIWDSSEATVGELYDSNFLETGIRQELGNSLEVLKLIEGVG